MSFGISSRLRPRSGQEMENVRSIKRVMSENLTQVH